MLTKNEITALNLSPTKKDFVQIWNELLDVAGKLSERWDPTSTNESDPGIVLLKALTGIADKLNYNIDKNTLEAFMPTAAQEESMRKLCDMLGYSMKYYRSAVVDVTVRYYNAEPTSDEYNIMNNGMEIPKFTVITNADKDISYFTLDSGVVISNDSPSRTITCMEGQLVRCESNNDDNIITSGQIINNKFYLPETQIAENGIFIYNVAVGADSSSYVDASSAWTQVSNLNAQPSGSSVFKFCFDSYEGRPYLEFPEDYSELFGEGVFIYYARTNGVNGNISPNQLTQIELPTTGDWENVDAESFSAENTFAATTGANAETIEQAYNSFKKTIGTFETLVTCRDYMNKIYSLTDNTKPLVSNALVTDIRNDLNCATCICSCDGTGIYYKERAIEVEEQLVGTNITSTSRSIRINKPEFEATAVDEDTGEITGFWKLEGTDIKLFTDVTAEDTEFINNKNGEVYEKNNNWVIKQLTEFGFVEYPTGLVATRTVNFEDKVDFITTRKTPAIDRFDIVLYPFKTYNQVRSSFADLKTPYDRSFTYSKQAFNNVKALLDDSKCKTLAHNIKAPRIGDIVTINNYLKLSATIATTDRVSSDEGEVIIDNVKKALVNSFNLHELDFGEEIPFESLIEVIEKADVRIKAISLNEPALYTTYSVIEGYSTTDGEPIIAEYAVASKFLSTDSETAMNRLTYQNASTFDTAKAKDIYNKLALRNVLAGRVPLFKYNEKFATSFSESPYQATAPILETSLDLAEDDPRIPTPSNRNTLWVDRNGATYRGYFSLDENGDPKVEYTKTFTPTVYGTDPEKDQTANLLTNIAEGTVGIGETAPLTSINAYCTIAANGYAVDDKSVDKVVSNEAESDAATTDASNKATKSGDDNSSSNTNGDSNSQAANSGADSTTNQAQNNAGAGADNTAATAETGTGSDTEFLDDPQAEDVITNVKLADGEYIKFRAPNFVTDVTYPAYVNYNLQLKTGQAADAVPCEAVSLFDIFSGDEKPWSEDNQNTRWEKVFKYFTERDATYGSSFKKTLKLSQKISKLTEAAEASEEGEEAAAAEKEAVLVTIDNTPVDQETESFEAILNKSGCIKLVNVDRKPLLEWDTSDGDPAPRGIGPEIAELDVPILSTPFITSAADFNTISANVDAALATMQADEGSSLPTECAWRITFEFEYIPIEPASLNAWETFLRFCAENTTKPESPYYNIFDFVPVEENNTILYRKFTGGYDPGKYKTVQSEKLLKFTKTYFNTIPDERMSGLFLIKEAGSDAVADSINNDEEYTLGDGEYLFIEYTPSSTSEDGASNQSAEPVKKVYGKGTIIKPKGFADSVKNTESDEAVSSFKTVSFTTAEGAIVSKSLGSLGANEQIEIRKYAKTVFNKDTFELYVYKNFNNCPELEKIAGNNGVRSYTLKDGEYVFYTDKNKTELAYYSTGTTVTLNGKATLRKASENIDIATIFSEGIAAIPWSPLMLTDNDSIEFQEYQYITLGPKDTLVNLSLVGANNEKCLNHKWQFCDDVKYLVAGDDKPKSLPAIHCPDRQGNGWEACSILKLNVSPENAQTLRNTGQVKTSVVLGNVSAIGAGSNTEAVVISPEKAGEPLAFKTNVACVSNGDTFDLDDLPDIYNDIKSFELKTFKEDSPAIVVTEKNKIIECTDSMADMYQQAMQEETAAATADTGLTNSDGEAPSSEAVALINALTADLDKVDLEDDLDENSQLGIVSKKSYVDHWNSINLEDIRCSSATSNSRFGKLFDKALTIPVLLLPDTYGICCFYVDFTADTNLSNDRVWLEVAPGTQHKDVVIFNIDQDYNDDLWEVPKNTDGTEIPNASHRLYLLPGINCLRISSINKIYIKASENASGTVYFDSLRLVDKSFKDSLGNVHKNQCEGLNIEQIGYLYNDKDGNGIKEAKKTLQENRVSNSIEKAKSMRTACISAISENLAALTSNKTKLTELVSAEDALLKDLTSILASGGSINNGEGGNFAVIASATPEATAKAVVARQTPIKVEGGSLYALSFSSGFLAHLDEDLYENVDFVKIIEQDVYLNITEHSASRKNLYKAQAAPDYPGTCTAPNNAVLSKVEPLAEGDPEYDVNNPTGLLVPMSYSGIKNYIYIFETRPDTIGLNINFMSQAISNISEDLVPPEFANKIILDDVCLYKLTEKSIPVTDDELGDITKLYYEYNNRANLVENGNFETGSTRGWSAISANGGILTLMPNFGGDESLSSLVGLYKVTLNALDDARTLLETFNTNSNEALEAELITVLNSLSDPDQCVEQVDKAIQELQATVFDKLEKLSEEDIIEAFSEDCANNSFIINQVATATNNFAAGRVSITGSVIVKTDDTNKGNNTVDINGETYHKYYLRYTKLANTLEAEWNDSPTIIFYHPSSIDSNTVVTVTGNLIKHNNNMYIANALPVSSVLTYAIFDNACQINAESGDFNYKEAKATIISDSYTNALPKLRDKAAENYEKYFTEQLQEYLTQLNALTVESTNGEINALLNTLSEDLDSTDYPKLKSYVLKLKELVEQDDLNIVLSEMTTAASAGDYSALYTALLKLRGILQTADIKQLVTQVVETFNGKDYTAFTSLVEELETLLGTVSSVIASIDAVIPNVQAKLVQTDEELATQPDTTILNSVAAIVTTVGAENSTSLVLVVSDLISELEEIATSNLRVQISTVIETLTANDNSKIAVVLEGINDLVSGFSQKVTEARDQLTATLPLDLAKLDTWVFDAVLEVWPEELKTRWTTIFDNIKVLIDYELQDILYGTGQAKPDYSTADADDEEVSTENTAQVTLYSTYANSLNEAFYTKLAADLSDSEIYSKYKNISRAISDCRQANGFNSLAHSINSALSKNFNRVLSEFSNNTSATNILTSNSTAYIIELLAELEETTNTQLRGVNLTARPQLLSEIRTALVSYIGHYERLVNVIKQVLLPNISKFDLNKYVDDKFFADLFEKLKGVHTNFREAGIAALSEYYSIFKCEDAFFDAQVNDLIIDLLKLPSDILANKESYKEALDNSRLYDKWEASEVKAGYTVVPVPQLKQQALTDYSLIPDILILRLVALKVLFAAVDELTLCIEELENNTETVYYNETAENDPYTLKYIIEARIKLLDNLYENIRIYMDAKNNSTGSAGVSTYNSEIYGAFKRYLFEAEHELSELNNDLSDIFNEPENTTEAKPITELAIRVAIENQLLKELRQADNSRDFYYNVPIEFSYAIDFNDSESVNNTLLNPATNYDSNNVNNSFVVSKLDVDYLSSGLQIARTSRRS